MFLKGLFAGEIKLKLTLAVIYAMALLIFLFYYQYSNKKLLLDKSQQILYNDGKTYENEINSELKKFIVVSEMLSSTFSKTYKSDDFKKDVKGHFKSLLFKHERLQSITLVLNDETPVKDSSTLYLQPLDSMSENIIRFNKSKSGITEDYISAEFSSLNSKVSVLKTIESEQIKILSPEIKMSDGNQISVIPIATGLFNGKQYIGYLVLYVALDWLKEGELQQNASNQEIEAFVSTGNGQVFSLNSSGNLLAEPIAKVCLPCQGLISEKGSDFNVANDDGYVTLCFPVQIDEIMEKWHICLRTDIENMYNTAAYNELYNWIVFGLVLFGGLFLIFIFIGRNEIKMNELVDMSNKVLQSDSGLSLYTEDKQTNSKISRIRNNIIKVSKVISEINSKNISAANGNSEQKFNDELGNIEVLNSAQRLYSALSDSKSKIDKINSEFLQNKEFDSGQDKISEILQLNYRDINGLCENFIHCLVDLLGISMGAIFLPDKNDKSLFNLVISYAYNENRHQKRSFKLGESLVGACAAEQRTIYLKKLPDNYLSIVSGLGLASPKSILLVPLLFENNVLGVIELGALTDFDNYKVKFIETAAVKAANTLSLSQNNILNAELLEKTKLQALEIEEHDRKTIKALDELKHHHEITAQNEARIRYKLEAMNNTLMMVEYTTQGILIDANYKFLNAMHYSIEEIKGINVLDLLRDTEREELVKIIENVKAGNFFEGIMKRHTKLGHEKWFLATYTPVYNQEGNVENILFFAIDITRIRVQEEQLKRKTEDLKKQVNDLRSMLNA